MENYTFELAKEFNFPHISIYRRLRDGEHVGYRVNANEGYRFYDTTANDYETDPETLEKIPVTYYSSIAYFPKNYNFDNFHYVAVPVAT